MGTDTMKRAILRNGRNIISSSVQILYNITKTLEYKRNLFYVSILCSLVLHRKYNFCFMCDPTTGQNVKCPFSEIGVIPCIRRQKHYSLHIKDIPLRSDKYDTQDFMTL